jgi:hypothetical protein
VVAGNAITLSSEVFPDDAGVNEVMFQYRKEGTTAWTNIGLGAPVMSYTKTWDTTGLENGARYQVRAIVNGQDSSYFKITTLVVNNATTSPDVYEEKNGIHKKRVKVNPRKSNFVALPDGTSIYVPHGALPESGTPEVIIEEVYNVGGVANAVDISITGISKFDKDLTITIPYQDANNDGIVDGTAVNENDLILRWYNPDTLQWEPLYDSVVYPDENFLSGKTNHLTIFGIGPVVAAVAAGGGAASMGTQRNVSYCFIATAAYGTPMAKEVMALREFRDRFLIRDNIGRKFVWYYYRYSPPIARFISDKPKLKALVRFLLKPIVKIAKVMVS